MSKVTIITATTGSDYLSQNLKSVQEQTYGDIQHLVVVDGEEHLDKVVMQLEANDNPNIDLLILPYATGTEQYNGHRIYGASTYLAKGDYICYLDEDNWLERNHVQSLMDIVPDDGWAASLRKIVDPDGNYICNDDCESLGNWKSVIDDYFVDVNCFFFPNSALSAFPLCHFALSQITHTF
jgi:GT2 family glycosyltransferase